MGAYYSDEGPLSGFVYQRRNPIVSSRAGLVRGGGHGSIVHAPDGSLWAFYTIPMPCAHLYERRIGMDRVEVDEKESVSPTVGFEHFNCSSDRRTCRKFFVE